jgi:hypothetical protein
MEWNCSEWRALCVSDAINAAAEADTLTGGPRKDWHAKLIHISGFMSYLNPAIQDLVMPMDLVIVQRNIIVEHAVDVIKYWQGMGKTVAVDLDDQYQGLPWSNPAHPFWIENKQGLDPPPLVTLEKGLRTTNALISPNRLLLKDWEHACKGYHLPNYARLEWWKNVTTRAEQKKLRKVEDRVVIGWGGSVSHYDSWWGAGIREAAAAISRRHPEVLWMICGNDPRLYSQLPVPSTSKMLQTGVQPNEWPKVVHTFDIGVAPLHGPYDQRRSWIKTMEYSLAGTPWVATTGEPYRDHAMWGTLVKNEPEAWESAIEEILRDLPHQQEICALRIPMVQKEMCISNKLDEVERIYKEIINNFNTDSGELPNVYYVNWEKL